jgi:hypothetical protein
VHDNPVIEEEKGAIPMRTCCVGGDTDNGAVKGVAILQPVRKSCADRRVAEDMRGVPSLAQLREECPIQTVIGAGVGRKLGIGNVRDASDGKVAKPTS